MPRAQPAPSGFEGFCMALGAWAGRMQEWKHHVGGPSAKSVIAIPRTDTPSTTVILPLQPLSRVVSKIHITDCSCTSFKPVGLSSTATD